MTRHVFGLLLLGALGANVAAAQAKTEARPAASSPCRVEPADYRGWQAQQISNHWVQLTIVPQNGGRLMQVTFAGHPYFFVNPKYAGSICRRVTANGSTMAATSCGSCRKEMTTNSIGQGGRTSSTTAPFPFERFRKDSSAKSNLPARPTLKLEFSSFAQSAWTPTPHEFDFGRR